MDPADFAGFNLEAARQFLAELPLEIRRRGERMDAEGGVVELLCESPGTAYVASLKGTPSVETRLTFDTETRSWWESCSCPAGGGCDHTVAAMRALLAEHGSAAVRTLSAGKARPKKGPAVPASRGGGQLTEAAQAAAGRPLSRIELEFLARVEDRFAQLPEKPQLTGEDLLALGIRFQGPHAWEKIDLWPAPPRTILEFWTYIALAADERELKWPEFLKPITELEPLRAKVKEWRRGRDVERWRQLLTHLQPGAPTDGPEGDTVELRMRLTDTEVAVEYRKAGAPDWSVIKPGRFKDFDEKSGDDLDPELALLWQPLAQRARYGYAVNLVYHETQTRRLLNRLLRLPSLAQHIVGIDGEPLQRPADPLRWELSPAADESDDYLLRLKKADGSPAPKALIILPGRPTLLVTRDALWTSAPIEDRAVDPTVETRIPAPALETPAGVRFLHQHGIPLPPRLADRVAVVRLRPKIRGELRTIAFGNDTEYAVLEVLAVREDGTVQERWTGSAWVEEAGVTAPPGRLITYDRAGLQEVTRQLEPAGFKWDFARQRWLMRVTAKFPDAFLDWLSGLPPELMLELRGELDSLRNASVAGQVRLTLEPVESGTDWFDLRVILDVADALLTQEEIRALLDARGKWVRLGSKGWRKLEFKLTEEEDGQLARMGINPRELSDEPQRIHALQLADPAAEAFLGAEIYRALRHRAEEIRARVTPEVPTTLKADLRPYQRDGFHFLCYLAENRFGGVLADDMGLGKTLQTLAWIAWLRTQAEPGAAPSPTRRKTRKAAAAADTTAPLVPAPFLVVCPKSVTDNWRAEAERFVPDLKVKVWAAEEVKLLPSDSDCAELHVINYNQLRMIGESLSKVAFRAVILDEGQYIKNPTSITAQLARGLNAAHRLILSGTPIENRLMDLWSLMSFAMPGILGSRTEFSRLFDSKTDPLARRRLAARVRPFLLRRTKTQVARDLPDRVEEDLFCELEGEQRLLYRAELKRAQSMLLRVNTPAALAKHRFNFLTSLLRLRQICCDPRLVQEEAKAESAKLDALLETLEPLMEEGQKVLVFSQFVEMLELLRNAITERGWHNSLLVGATENRGDLVRAFQEKEGASVFLISLKAGGFGLNLTAASYVILFDPWWNPAVEAQAIDRTHRIGQTQKVMAYRLLIKNSVEEKIRALQKAKSTLASDLLGEETFSQGLTLDDFRFLLSD
jgi:hypothetical protein